MQVQTLESGEVGSMKRYIAEMLDEYLAGSLSPWHMPGHKRKTFFGGMWDEMFRHDVTEVPGTDDYHHPEGAILASERAAAGVYGTAYSHYLVGGSTAGILAGILALAELFRREYGEEVRPVFLVGKNVHRSVHNALRLAGAGRIDLIPEEDEDYGPVLPEEVRRKIDAQQVSEADSDVTKDPSGTVFGMTGYKSHAEGSRGSWGFAGCIITSPTYGGAISPLKEIREILSEEGIPLMVDEAHGAHLPFIKETAALSGISCGAEIVVQSLHKTLPALTQTAVIHLTGQRGEDGNADEVPGKREDWYDADRLEKCLKEKLAVVQSSSPSYILMVSAEQAVAWADEHRKAFEEYLHRIQRFRASLRESTTCFRLAEYQPLQDPTRITLRFKDESSGIPMVQVSGQLEEQHGIVAELAGDKELILISTVADTDEDLQKLMQALGKVGQQESVPDRTVTVPCDPGSPAEEDIYVYPPGILIVHKGEMITEEAAERIRREMKAGRRIYGLKKDM